MGPDAYAPAAPTWLRGRRMHLTMGIVVLRDFVAAPMRDLIEHLCSVAASAFDYVVGCNDRHPLFVSVGCRASER